jgi:hypothetical protein
MFTLADLEKIGVYRDNFQRFTRDNLFEQQTGTISVTATSTTITGVGTAFASTDVGKYIKTAGGQMRTIATVVNTTSGTVTSAFTTTEANANYFTKLNILTDYENWVTDIADNDVAIMLRKYIGQQDYADAENNKLWDSQDGTITVSGTDVTGTDTAFYSKIVGKNIKTAEGEQIREIATVTDEDTATVTVAFTTAETGTPYYLDRSSEIARAEMYLTAWKMLQLDDYDTDGYKSVTEKSINYEKQNRMISGFYNTAMNILISLGYGVNK